MEEDIESGSNAQSDQTMNLPVVSIVSTAGVSAAVDLTSPRSAIGSPKRVQIASKEPSVAAVSDASGYLTSGNSEEGPSKMTSAAIGAHRETTPRSNEDANGPPFGVWGGMEYADSGFS